MNKRQSSPTEPTTPSQSVNMDSELMNHHSSKESHRTTRKGATMPSGSRQPTSSVVTIQEQQGDTGLSRLGGVNKRRLTSTATKRHVCDRCDKRFDWPSELERHKRIHTGEKPFICKHCDKGFQSDT